MKLGKVISDYINEIGIEAAETEFNRKPATIKSWLKTQTFPQDVIEVYLDNRGSFPKEPEEINIGEAIPDFDQLRYDGPSLPEIVAKIEDLDTAVRDIQAYLAQLDEYERNKGATVTPAAQPMRVPWAPAGPTDGNFRSAVRPGQGVPAQTLRAPAPATVPISQKRKFAPASTWLTPIPIRK